MAAALATSAPAVADDPTWDPASSLGATNGDGLVVVSDSWGNDTATWSRWRTFNGVRVAEAVAATRPSNGGWSKVRVLGRAARSTGVTVATAPDGAVTAVWVDESLDGAGRVLASRLRTATFNGKAWSTASDVSAESGRMLAPRLSVGPTGTAVVTWTRRRGDRFAALAAVRDDLGAWSAAHRLDDGTHRRVAADAVGIDDAGNATVLYTGGYGIRAQRWSAGSWSDAVSLTVGMPTQYDFEVAADGRAAIAFTAGDLAPVGARFMDAEGSWGAAVTVDERPAPVHDSAVAIEDDHVPGWGVAWTSGQHQVRLREWDGAVWTDTQVVATLTGQPTETILIYRRNSDATLAWNERFTTGASRVSVLTRTDGAWSGDPTALSGSSASLRNLRVAHSDDGHVVTLWDRTTGPDEVRGTVGDWYIPATIS
ncbi:MAG: hypothetical protein U0R80_13415 [Nocardioidaceae bacterium]